MHAGNVLIARQPVLDRGLDVMGYRLAAHATGVADALSDIDEARAAARVIHDAFLEMDVWAVTGGKPAHLSFPRELLLGGVATLLPPSGTVVELDADVGADDEVVEAATDLRSRGYRIALAGVAGVDERLGTVPADLIKLPMSPRAAELVRQARRQGVSAIVTGVADASSYLSARHLEPDGFEGSFLQSPALVRGRSLQGSRVDYVQLLREVHRPELDFDDLETRIKHEVSLSWKFLNYANAAFFGWRARMTSIRQGLVLLGEAGVRRWVSLVATSALADGLPTELVTAAVGRARFAERVAESAVSEEASLHAFLTGMFSLLDTMVDEPMESLLTQVAVPEPVSAAILRREGSLGTVLDLVESYERGDWERVEEAAAALGVEPPGLLDFYLESVGWASEVGGPAVAPSTPSTLSTPSAAVASSDVMDPVAWGRAKG